MKKFIFILSAIILIPLLFNSFKSGNNKFGPKLSYLIDNTNQNVFKVYVYFNDKGPDSEQKLQNPLGLVTQRSLDRRKKVFPENQLVDFTDIPLYENYINEISQYTLNVRQQLKWFNALSVEATRDKITEMANLNYVTKMEIIDSYIMKNNDIEKTPVQFTSSKIINNNILTDSLNYGTGLTQIAQINVNLVHNQGIFGQGVMIASLDDGFKNQTHEAFTTLPMRLVNQYDFQLHLPGAYRTDASHGTSTISLVGGYKPGQMIGPAFRSMFIACRTEVDSFERNIEMDNWSAAAQWVDSLGADVITSSLGYLGFDAGQTSWTWSDMNGHTMPVTLAAVYASHKGIVVCNSAGNNGEDVHNTLNGPADADSIVTVGAVDETGIIASFSSVGPTTDVPPRIKPDVMAMGSGNYVATTGGTNVYSFGSGTSFSCPITAGVAALILSANKSLTPLQVRGILRKFANNSSSPNNLIGWGIINAQLSVDSARKMDNVPPVITHTQQGNTPNTGVINLKTKIADNGIIRLWSNQAPEMYYRKFISGNWTTFTGVIPYYAQNDSFFFQIPGSAGGTQIEYYFAAQDIALPTPNMSSLPAGGSGINPPGSTPPTSRFTFTITGIGNNTSTLPTEFKLHNNYPNPFNPVTKIKFDLPKSTNVKLSVYDILGRETSNILNGNLEAGYYEISFDGSKLSSGIYFYKIQTSEFTDVKKMILNK
jgi:hypothetical protein